MSLATVRCLCGKASVKFHHPLLMRLECACNDCHQAKEWAASGGGARVLSAVSTNLYFLNDCTINPEPSTAEKSAYRATLLRKDGKSTRLVSTCCNSILGIDHPWYFGQIIMVPSDTCRVEGLDLPPPIARIHMEDYNTATDGPPPPIAPDVPVLSTEDPDIDAKAEVYRVIFRTAKTKLPRVGTSIQEILAPLGPPEVLGLQEGQRIPA